MQRPDFSASVGTGTSLGEVAQKRIRTNPRALLHIERFGLGLSNGGIRMGHGKDGARHTQRKDHDNERLNQREPPVVHDAIAFRVLIVATSASSGKRRRTPPAADALRSRRTVVTST